MKKITLNTVQIKDKYYFKLPDIIADALKLSNDDKVEVTIHNKKNQDQAELFDQHGIDAEYYSSTTPDSFIEMRLSCSA